MVYRPLMTCLLVVLLTSPLLARDVRATVPDADSEDLLVEGPLAVTVERRALGGGRIETYQGTLHFLTRKHLIYRRPNQPYPDIIPASRDVLEISTQGSDGEVISWRFDPETEQFSGKRLPCDGVDISPVPGVQLDPNVIYFHLTEKLFGELKASLINESLLSPLLEQARAEVAFGRDNRLNPALISACGSIVELGRHREQRDRDAREAITAAKLNAEELLGDYQETIARTNLEGFAVAADSGFDLLTSFGAAVVVSGVNSVTGERFRRRMVGVDQELSAKLATITQKYQKEVADRLMQFEDGPARDVWGAERKLLSDRIQNRDWTQAEKLISNRIGQTERDPLLMMHLYWMSSLIPSQDRNEWSVRKLEMAKRCVAMVRQIPRGKIHDRGRAMGLELAARIASEAAMMEAGINTWIKSYSPSAAFAVRVCDRLLELEGVVDPNGEWRERRAWALAQSGQIEEALEQAFRIRELRKDTSRFGYFLAKLLMYRDQQGDHERALSELDYAIKQAGCTLLEQIRNDPDLGALAGDPKTRSRFQALTSIVLTTEPSMVSFGFRRGIGSDATLINNSAFELREVSITGRAEVIVAGRRAYRTINYPKIIARLPANEKVVCPGLLKLPEGEIITAYALTMTCEQGTKMVLWRPSR